MSDRQPQEKLRKAVPDSPAENPRQADTGKRQALGRRKLGDPGKKPVRWKRLRRLFATRGWQVYGAGVCLTACAVLVFAAGLVLDGVWSRSLAGLEHDLQMQLELAKLQAEASGGDEDDGASGDVLNGYDREMESGRRTGDDRVVNDMLSHATTWNSRGSYEQSRKELLAHYDWLTAETNPEFLLKFFPPGEELYAKLDGVILSDPLSDGRNISFESMRTYLLDEDGSGVRRYFAEVTTQSIGQVGGVATGHLVATYETRADGSVWNMKCYTV